jgi:hypothetical protein
VRVLGGGGGVGGGGRQTLGCKVSGEGWGVGWGGGGGGGGWGQGMRRSKALAPEGCHPLLLAAVKHKSGGTVDM